jgi:hypothetical protein
MECYKCKAVIPNGEEREHKGEMFCEDCYIDILSPVKFCDPWASFNAQSFAKNNPEAALTDDQKKIIQVLKETGGTGPDVLMERLKGQVSPEDGERSCASLHRMGKISIENRNGTVFISLK